MIDLGSMELPPQVGIEEQEGDRNCDLAKREHKYFWLWNEDGKITDWVCCGKCGQTKHLGK